jgi:PAS domain S-box-containing protein
MAMTGKKVPRVDLEELLPMRSFWWLLESAPDGIVIVDHEGRIMLVNARAEQMFGYSEDELVGEFVEVLIPERFRDVHVQHRAEYEAAPRTRPMGIGLELFGLHRDGTDFPVEISLSPVVTAKGLLVMAIIRDVSEYKREHFISETLQQAMLTSVPSAVDGLRMGSAYQSAYEGAQVGGDFYDVLTLAPGSVGVIVGDVSGKGVTASISTALAKYTLRAYAHENPDPSAVAERLNSAICEQVATETFITLFYALIDTIGGVISYVNAGHMPPLYLDCLRDEVGELVDGDLPLGVMPGPIYSPHTLQFARGDRMLLYTDGVTDARDGQGFFGVDRLKEFLIANRNESPVIFVAHLMETLKNWSGGHFHDDVAMLLLAWD